MFGFLHRLGSLHGNSMDALVREISDRSVAAARSRLKTSTATMSVAELRGYLRARAAQPVRMRARQVMANRRAHSAPMDELIDRALERTVHLLVRETMVQPVVAPPAVHVSFRAAG